MLKREKYYKNDMKSHKNMNMTQKSIERSYKTLKPRK